jgi:hypothetical protein
LLKLVLRAFVEAVEGYKRRVCTRTERVAVQGLLIACMMNLFTQDFGLVIFQVLSSRYEDDGLVGCFAV